MVTERCTRLFASIVLAMSTGSVTAQSFQAAELPVAGGLTLLIDQSSQRDSNLFRLPDGARPALGNGQRHDRIAVTSLSGRASRQLGRQQFELEFLARRSAYREYDYLDYTAKGGRAAWQWRIGRLWSGRLSSYQSQALRGFADSRTFEQSINTYRRTEADANFWWHPQWATGVGLTRLSSRYNDDGSDNAEYDETWWELKLNYRPSPSTSLSLVAADVDGDYPHRSPTHAARFGSGYAQNSYQLRGNWQPTPQSRWSGYLGWTQRRYQHLSQRDFSGITGRLSYDWAPTQRFTLTSLVRRELGAETDLVDNFVVTEAISLAPQWRITERINLNGSIEWRQRQFEGDPDFGLVAMVGKDEEIWSGQLGATWHPRPYLSFSLSGRQERREADNSLLEYRADLVSISAQISW